VNYKGKSRRRSFLLIRSRTPPIPISSEFRGGGRRGGWKHQPPPSVRHWFPFTANLRLRRLTLKQSIYDDHGMNVETFHTNRQIMKDLNAVSLRKLLEAIKYTCGVKKYNAVCFLLGNSPASEFYMPTFRNTVYVPYENGTECSETSAYKIKTPWNYPEESVQHSEHCLFHLHRRVGTYPPMKMEQCVPKRRHIKLRRQGITQKRVYSIQNTVCSIFIGG